MKEAALSTQDRLWFAENARRSPLRLTGTGCLREHEKLPLEPRILDEFMKDVILGPRMLRKDVEDHVLELRDLADLAEHFATEILMSGNRMPDITKDRAHDALIGQGDN
jgi:hypothetical protein